MAQSKVKGISFDELDQKYGMTEEKKKKIASFEGNPKLVMPTPGDRKTDKIIRFLMAKDGDGNPTPVKAVKTDSPRVNNPDGIILLFTVEDFDDQGVEYDMNFSQSLNNELIRFAEKRGLKREDAYYKWFKLSAEKYDNEKFGESIAYRLRYMEDLNQVVSSEKKNIATQF